MREREKKKQYPIKKEEREASIINCNGWDGGREAWSSANEVHGHQMEDDVWEDEVRKTSLGGDAKEVRLVLRVCL